MPGALKYAIIFILISIFAGLLYYATYFPFKACDDAYIYFVYAKNFVNGHGFVYNPGGERVEGFTSMLWMWIVIICYKISVNNFYSLLWILNCLMISYSLYRVASFIDNYYLDKSTKSISAVSLILITILFVIKGFADWTIFSLLEMGLWSALLVTIGIFLMEMAVGVRKSAGQRNIFALLIGLLVITRPESTLWGICFIFIYGYLHSVRGESRSSILKLSAKPFIVFIISLVSLTIFRLQYFGYPLSNTYYAKVSADRIDNIREGILYIIRFVFIYPVYYLSIIATLFLLVRLAKRFLGVRKIETGVQAALYVNAVIAGISLIIPMVNGGDHFSLFRLFQPVVPFYLLLFINPLFRKSAIKNGQYSISRPVAITAIFAIVPFLYLINMPKYLAKSEMSYQFSILPEFSGAENNKKESLWLNGFFNFPAKPSIGRVWAGAYAFAYEGSTIDLMGLNNTLMAHALKIKKGPKNHAAFDIQTFFKLKPDLFGGELLEDTTEFIMPENMPDFKGSFENQIFKGMYYNNTFNRMYSPAIITSAAYQQAYFTYIRNDYIDTIREHNMTVSVLERKRSPI